LLMSNQIIGQKKSSVKKSHFHVVGPHQSQVSVNCKAIAKSCKKVRSIPMPSKYVEKVYNDCKATYKIS
jgi:hypothetical protein